MAAGILGIIDSFESLIQSVLIPLAFSLCLFYFFWGVAKYIKSAGNEKDTEQGKRIMIWGIVGLFVATSIWGIISFIQKELGIPEVKDVTTTNSKN